MLPVLANIGPDVVAPPPMVEQIFGAQIASFTSSSALVLMRFPSWGLTSWFRDVLANADAGGDAYSQHLVGLAFDADGPLEQKDEFVRALRRVGHVVVPEETHVHWQAFAPGLLRRLTAPPAAAPGATRCP